MNQSRHIPKIVSGNVQERHFFECAWCGIKLTERHHIIPFSESWRHIESNLILLCPNCHRQVHTKKIKTEELVSRKSTHCKWDRISGGLQFELKVPVIKLGGSTFINVPILFQRGDDPIITLEKRNEEFFLNARFYNQNGDLIFWMTENMYWSSVNFVIQSKRHEFTIKNEENNDIILRISQKKDYLEIEGRNYINGFLVDFTAQSINIPWNHFNWLIFENCKIAFQF